MTPATTISKIGFTFHLRNTNSAAANSATAIQSTVDTAAQADVPVKANSKIVTAADKIKPQELAFKPFRTSNA